ncbi:MAG: hypothetical protein J5994_08360 [Ruminococcus sp.]|nr:hypothetical protein [Ruminococcus sp.]
MTDKELKKLKRTELLELMLFMKKELDRVKDENAVLEKKLEEREADLDELLGRTGETLRMVSMLCENAGLSAEAAPDTEPLAEDTDSGGDGE